MKPRSPIFFLAICATSLSCSIFVGGPAYPEPPISSSAEDLQSVQSSVESAISNGLVSGRLTLTLTEEQLTAFLAARLSGQPNPVILDPQVRLRGQEMIIYGRARSGIFEANMAVTARFEVDETGTPHIRISHAEFGPMPMPQVLQDAIAAAVDEALTGYVGPAAIGFRLESIDITDGTMSIGGRLR